MTVEKRKQTSQFPAIHAPVHNTPFKGTPYLQEPGVVVLAIPEVNLTGMQEFLAGFDLIDPSLQFNQYLADPTSLPPAEQICKAAAQLCYMSFGPKRTYNEEAQKYFQGNIIPSGHGSVLEHANFTLLLYGTSRSITHELVRHRAGCAYSQVSQRYVSGKVLRFVERPEYQDDTELHKLFLERIDVAAENYQSIANTLVARQQAGSAILMGEAKTDLRKKVQQCARSLLPNETEAPIVMTGNIRAWRHILSMRASSHAEIEIRRLAFRIFLCLREVAPVLFADYEEVTLPDGTQCVHTDFPKV